MPNNHGATLDFSSSHLVSSPCGNPDGSIFRLYLESDRFPIPTQLPFLFWDPIISCLVTVTPFSWISLILHIFNTSSPSTFLNMSYTLPLLCQDHPGPPGSLILKANSCDDLKDTHLSDLVFHPLTLFTACRLDLEAGCTGPLLSSSAIHMAHFFASFRPLHLPFQWGRPAGKCSPIPLACHGIPHSLYPALAFCTIHHFLKYFIIRLLWVLFIICLSLSAHALYWAGIYCTAEQYST